MYRPFYPSDYLVMEPNLDNFPELEGRNMADYGFMVDAMCYHKTTFYNEDGIYIIAYIHYEGPLRLLCTTIRKNYKLTPGQIKEFKKVINSLPYDELYCHCYKNIKDSIRFAKLVGFKNAFNLGGKRYLKLTKNEKCDIIKKK